MEIRLDDLCRDAPITELSGQPREPRPAEVQRAQFQKLEWRAIRCGSNTDLQSNASRSCQGTNRLPPVLEARVLREAPTAVRRSADGMIKVVSVPPPVAVIVDYGDGLRLGFPIAVVFIFLWQSA